MKRILLIEDSTAQRKMVTLMLEKIGYEVDSAVNGQDGLTQIQVNPPDCLLLDMLMPIMDGVQVLEQLEPQCVKFPIIVLTADVDSSLKDHCMELGVTTFLTKPIKQDQLQQVLENIFNTSKPTEASCT